MKNNRNLDTYINSYVWLCVVDFNMIIINKYAYMNAHILFMKYYP